MTLVSFVSDFGAADEFVGVVHAVIARLAPGTTVVDLSHAVRPYDVRSAALMLWRSAPWLTPGVILGVVDPGVGTERRAIAVEVVAGGSASGEAEGRTVLVGPDNGLLHPAIARLGGALAAVELTPPDPPPPGATFAGRDVFAPAAARLAAGIPLAHLGPAIDASTLAGDPVPVPERGVEGTRCEVLWVDRFGNLQLNLPAADCDRDGPPLVVRVEPVSPGATAPAGASGPLTSPGGRDLALRVVGSYGEIPRGGLALVVDSYGMLSLCARESSAAERLGVEAGAPVLVVDPAERR